MKAAFQIMGDMLVSVRCHCGAPSVLRTRRIPSRSKLRFEHWVECGMQCEQGPAMLASDSEFRAVDAWNTVIQGEK